MTSAPNLRFADAALPNKRELPFHFAGRRLKPTAKTVEGAQRYNCKGGKKTPN
jgi:hypothetical protein